MSAVLRDGRRRGELLTRDVRNGKSIDTTATAGVVAGHDNVLLLAEVVDCLDNVFVLPAACNGAWTFDGYGEADECQQGEQEAHGYCILWRLMWRHDRFRYNRVLL